jgi:integrase
MRGNLHDRGGRGVASRTVRLLGAIFTYAIRNGICFDNPAHGIVRFADGRRQRRLTNDEYGSLDGHCRQSEVRKPAIAATWLMILTGWRRGEVLGLRWSELDLPRRTARLTDTKTAHRCVPYRTGVHGDPIAAGDPRSCVRQSIWQTDYRIPEDVAANR